MLFRGLGIGVVIFVCTSYGFLMKKNYLRRIYHLQEFILMLENLISEIQYKNCDLIENFIHLNQKKTYAYFVDSIITGLKDGQAVYGLWKKSCKELLVKTGLEKSDINIISNLGNDLGTTDREAQINHLTYYKKSLESILAELKNEKNEKCRLYSSMGIVCGVFFGILFI